MNCEGCGDEFLVDVGFLRLNNVLFYTHHKLYKKPHNACIIKNLTIHLKSNNFINSKLKMQ